MGRECGDVLISRTPIGNYPAGTEFQIDAIDVRPNDNTYYYVRAYATEGATHYVSAYRFERN